MSNGSDIMLGECMCSIDASWYRTAPAPTPSERKGKSVGSIGLDDVDNNLCDGCYKGFTGSLDAETPCSQVCERVGSGSIRCSGRPARDRTRRTAAPPGTMVLAARKAAAKIGNYRKIKDKYMALGMKKEDPILRLMAVSVPKDLAEKAVGAGYTLTKIKNANKQDLLRDFSLEDANLLWDNTQRKPIADDVVQRLLTESYSRCCMCWNFDRYDSIVIHHIEEHSRTRNDSYENLVVICPNHHSQAHMSSTIARPPLPPEVLRQSKQDFIQAIADGLAGKRALPGRENRLQAIQQTEALATIHAFRQERIRKIAIGNTFVRLAPGRKVVIHLIPQEAFGDHPPRYPVEANFGESSFSGSFHHWGSDRRFNHDGILFLTHGFAHLINAGQAEPEKSQYAQLFKNGVIEAVDSGWLLGDGEKKGLSGPGFERYVINRFQGLLDALIEIGAQPPVFLFASFLEVKGVWIAASDSYGNSFNASQNAIDRDELLLEESVLDSLDVEPSEALRPVFDGLWRAAGWPRSLSYRSDGKWIPAS